MRDHLDPLAPPRRLNRVLIVGSVLLLTAGLIGGGYYLHLQQKARLLQPKPERVEADSSGPKKYERAKYTPTAASTNGIAAPRVVSAPAGEKPPPPPKPPAPPPAPKAAVKRAPGIVISHKPDARQVSAGTYTLAPGATVIPCQIYTAMNSDVGTSHFTAKVTRPVFDTKTGTHLLIPQNSTILGKDGGASLVFGNERLPTFSLRLARPDGSEVELGNSPVTDQQGQNGLVSHINRHWLRIYGAALVMGVLRGGQLVVQRELAQEAGVVLTQPTTVTERTLGRAIDSRPTIYVSAGELCNVIVLEKLELTEVL